MELVTAVHAATPNALVIVDCVTVWVGNLFARGTSPAARSASYGDLSAALSARTGATVVVSNEVGLGLHPETPLGREYRDELGRLNQQLANLAERSLLLVAGRAVPLSDPWEHLQ